MFTLNLPPADIKMVSMDGKALIQDIVRKRWLVLTPEEYVRQNFVSYLINHLNYPGSLISIERGLKVNKLNSRSDIVVYNNEKLPWILIECKAPQVKITQATLEQASKYNLKLKAEYLCVTNGLDHSFYRINFASLSYTRLENLPFFIAINEQGEE